MHLDFYFIFKLFNEKHILFIEKLKLFKLFRIFEKLKKLQNKIKQYNEIDFFIPILFQCSIVTKLSRNKKMCPIGGSNS